MEAILAIKPSKDNDHRLPKGQYSPLVESLIGVLSEDDLKNIADSDERARYILTGKI
ncbi:hypothetical protein RsTz2092_09580 [Deferribacterales bacterium RsTz2092]